jgi:hypothetical protein
VSLSARVPTLGKRDDGEISLAANGAALREID